VHGRAAPTTHIAAAAEPAGAQRPTVLVGECGGAWVPRLRALGWGRMWIARRPAPYDGEPWGLDNGAYRCHLAGRPFDEAAYLRRLERAHAAGVPYPAVVPDIVAGGIRFSVPAHRLCRWDPMWTRRRFDSFARQRCDEDRRLRIPGLFEGARGGGCRGG
jgi:hypothetical protein